MESDPRKNERVDMNKLAVKVTKAEGGAESLNIGEVKEVMRLTLEALDEYRDGWVLEAVRRAGNKKREREGGNE